MGFTQRFRARTIRLQSVRRCTAPCGFYLEKLKILYYNKRYDAFLNDHLQALQPLLSLRRSSHWKGYNIDGEEIKLPVRKKVADDKCLVWDTNERVAAVGPSICLNEMGEPAFFLPVSEETPTDSSFYFVSREQEKWRKTRITKTLHPFNASCLQLDERGVYRAFMITGSGEKIKKKGMDEYGWGQRVEEWVSEDQGRSWELRATFRRYQACVTRTYSLSLMAWSESGRIFSYSMVGEMRIARVLVTFGIPVNKARRFIELCAIMAAIFLLVEVKAALCCRSIFPSQGWRLSGSTVSFLS